jgi:N-acetylglucosaminyl-diphospho-decaprenol L-rhamnosyltransferase
MSAPIDVAVIIVSYKSAQPAIENLRSLLAERDTPGLQIRAVVVDNASGDFPELARAVAADGWSSWVTLIAAPRNGGFAFGCNLGIERAYADAIPDYICLLNPDTQVRAGGIDALVRFLAAHPRVGIAGPSFETGEGKDWHIAFRFPSLLGEIEQGLQLALASRLLRRWAIVRRMGATAQEVDWISGAAMMIRPEVFQSVGGLDENYFLFFEETDLCRRARQAGFATWYVPDSRVMHIGGYSTSFSSRVQSRFPAYWFESRRRYHAIGSGIARSMIIDVAAAAAHTLGTAKHLIRGRRRDAVPFFVRDLLHHSVLWRRNRVIPPRHSRIAAGAPAGKLPRAAAAEG